jgi:thioredoxin-dependent peroxiredoxin
MTLEIAPDFDAVDQTGQTVTLSALLARGPVALFFYPRAFTPVCTSQSCHFRDLAAEFAAVGAQPVGISADTVDRQASFAQQHQLGFPLLSDRDRVIARAFGVKRPGPLFNKRKTFVVGTDRRVLAEISGELDAKVHADRALEVLRAADATRPEGAA